MCHIWELGGGTLFTKLLETPLSPSKLPSVHVVIMVDLSEPFQLWFTLEALLKALDTNVDHALKSPRAKEAGLEEQLKRLRKERSDAEHHDAKKMQPFRIPLVILGGKYDLFQQLEPEKKKIVCRALRFVAHYHGAALQFYR